LNQIICETKERQFGFQKALGFDKTNWQQLASQLYLDESIAVFERTTPYGERYSQVIPITGPNGRTLNVAFIFQKDSSGRVTFITGIPANK
jgi:filamentous hemagglutinin